MTLRTSSSDIPKETMETWASSASSRSKTASISSFPSSSAISLTFLPSYWGWFLAEAIMTDSQSRVTVAGPSLIFRLVSGSLSRSRSLSAPPSWAQWGMRADSPVLEAMYGYWSKVTSTPRRRPSSTSFNDSTVLPQYALPEALKWAIWTGTAALSPISLASLTASSRVLPSPRMWVK